MILRDDPYKQICYVNTPTPFLIKIYKYVRELSTIIFFFVFVSIDIIILW